MRLLLLAGTAEAVQIAQAIAREPNLCATAALPDLCGGIEPDGIPLPVRIGGWGEDSFFENWLREEGVEAVLDATHPFAHRISHRSARVSSGLGIPYIQFLRPAWTPGGEDRWVFLNCEDEAARHVPKGARVYLDCGRHRMDRFVGISDRTVWIPVETPASESFPFSSGGFLHRPKPRPVETEIEGLRALGVDWVVTRNTGGQYGFELINAARALGLPIGMIRRPPQPESPKIQTVSEAMAWVRRRAERNPMPTDPTVAATGPNAGRPCQPREGA